jgi:hypothetical protein
MAPCSAPIVIRDEEPTDATLHPMCLPSTEEETAPVRKLAAAEPASACPLMMPYCTDEDQPAMALEMPHTAKTACGKTGCLPSCETSEFPWPEDSPKCQEDAHYHEQYSGIPYVAPKAESPTPIKSKVPSVQPGQEHCKQPGASGPKMHKARYRGGPICPENCPGHPDIDTMEYRKSDGGLNEYGPGGPL